MRGSLRVLTAVGVLATTLLVVAPVASHAGAAADAALALGAFAVFSQLFLLPALAHPAYSHHPRSTHRRPPFTSRRRRPCHR
jgi:hypothetical protein